MGKHQLGAADSGTPRRVLYAAHKISDFMRAVP
jgi:hypothetical protein